MDVLCDSYTVQKDDHIWEILRRKGRMAEEDFPRFVSVLKELNPDVKDVDRIYPNQKILIPLKEVKVKESNKNGKEVKGKPRYITIPIIPDVLYKTRTVRPGDCVSKLVTAYLGVPWNQLSGGYFQTFKRLNPYIRDMDLIYPGQTIRIPELAAQQPPLTEPGSGVSKKKVKEQRIALEEIRARVTSQNRLVPPKVVAELAEQAVREVVTRKPSIDQAGEVAVASREALSVWKKGRKEVQDTAVAPPTEQDTPWQRDIITKTLTQLGGKLLMSGECYFPVKNGGDLTLDLSSFPVIELPKERHILLETGKGIAPDKVEAIRRFWKDLMIVHAGAQEGDAVVLTKLFRTMFGESVPRALDLPALGEGIRIRLQGDWILAQEADKKGDPPGYHCITLIEGPGEYTSPSVVTYLAAANIRIIDILTETSKENKVRPAQKEVAKTCPTLTIDGSGHEPFVSGLVRAIGYSYDSSVPLSFDYAGFQVQTTANLIYGGNGLDIVVDFGTFYGDTTSAIEASGLKALSIEPDDKLLAIAKDLLDLTEIPYTEAPVFFAANRKLSKTTSLSIPGLLLSYANKKRALLTEQELDSRLCSFLKEQGIGIFRIEKHVL